jgi:hypothetical protein
MPESVTAYRAYAIFADYDGNAPDSGDVVLVETEELVKQVCQTLNEDPREYAICYCEGWEWSKRWAWHPVTTENASEIVTDYESAMTVMRGED